jgi:hypothetical protein
MESDLLMIQKFLQNDSRLAGFNVRRQGDELHLEKGGDSFARLIPTAQVGKWQLEYFREEEGWEISRFVGTVEECLEFMADHRHYVFWER